MKVSIKDIRKNIQENIDFIRQHYTNADIKSCVFRGIQAIRFMDGKPLNSFRAIGFYRQLNEDFYTALEETDRRLKQKVTYIQNKEN